MTGRNGAAFLVLAADDRGVGRQLRTVAVAQTGGSATAATAAHGEAARRTRFLWSLDKEGRFGPPDEALAAALGRAAPAPGEAIEELSRRACLDHGEALLGAIPEQETFSGLKILWRTEGDATRATPVTLSAAPLFDGGRAFAGFKGFGTIGEPIAADPPRADRGRAGRGVRGRSQRGAPDRAHLRPGRRPRADGGRTFRGSGGASAAQQVEPADPAAPTEDLDAPGLAQERTAENLSPAAG